MSHSNDKLNGVYFNWFPTEDWRTAAGTDVWRGGATPNSLSYSNYSTYEPTIRDNFYVNDDTLRAVTNSANYIFIQAYSFLNIPDVSESDTFDINFRLLTDDGIEMWLDLGGGFETVVKNRTNHAPKYDYGSITVPDNSTIPIKVEWWEWGGGAVLDVQWSETSGGTTYTSIKNEYLTLNPIFTTVPLISVKQNSQYSYTIKTQNAHHDNVEQTLTIVNAPSWLSLNSSSGELSGTPGSSDIGDHAVVVRATDSGGLTTEQSFIINVENIEDEAIGSVAVIGLASEGGSLGVDLSSVIDPDGSIIDVFYQWQISNDGTNWTNIDGATSSSYMIAADQSEVGKFLRVLTITTDSFGGMTDFVSSATLAIENVNDAPEITSTGITSAKQNELYSYVFSALDIDPNDTITLNAEGIPSWLSFNASSGELSGTPTNLDIGDHNIAIRASDSEGEFVEETFTIMVEAAEQILSSKIRSKVDETLILDFFADDIFWRQGDNITDFQLKVELGDTPSEVSIDSVEFNSSFLGDYVYDPSSGQISLEGIGSTGFSDPNEPLFSIIGKQSDTLTDLKVATSNIILNDLSHQNTLTFLDKSPGEVNASIQTKSGTAVEGALISMFNGLAEPIISLNSDANGLFNFELQDDMKVDIQKSYTNSGAVTVSDALDTLKLSIGLKKSDGTLHPYDFIAADFNKDGKVSVWDALHILRYSIDLDVLEAHWVFIRNDIDTSQMSKQSIIYDANLSVNFSDINENPEFIGILVGDVNNSF